MKTNKTLKKRKETELEGLELQFLGLFQCVIFTDKKKISIIQIDCSISIVLYSLQKKISC